MVVRWSCLRRRYQTLAGTFPSYDEAESYAANLHHESGDRDQATLRYLPMSMEAHRRLIAPDGSPRI